MADEKTVGFLVAVEGNVEVTSAFIQRAIHHYMDDDNNYQIYGECVVNVEGLGEIDCYPEETK